MKSFKSIVEQFEKICNAHKQLNSFTFGDIFEVDLSNEVDFAKAHLTPAQHYNGLEAALCLLGGLFTKTWPRHR